MASRPVTVPSRLASAQPRSAPILGGSAVADEDKPQPASRPHACGSAPELLSHLLQRSLVVAEERDAAGRHAEALGEELVPSLRVAGRARDTWHRAISLDAH